MRPKKPHVVKMKLANGTIREYVYAYRGGPRLDGCADPAATDKIRAFRLATYRETAKGRWAREEMAFLRGSDSPVLRSAASKLSRNAKTRASKRGLVFDLSTDVIYGLLRSQHLRCAVSGLPFDLSANNEKTYSRNPFGPSIDRIDSRDGYVPSNVRLVLVACNFALNEWGEDNFRMIAEAVAEHKRIAA